MAVNYFKQILGTYYKDTFLDPTGKEGKNFIKNIDNCLRRNLSLQPNQIIILPQGCSSKMIQTRDEQIYSICLSQFGDLPVQTLSNIIDCVNPNVQPSCAKGVNFTIVSEGEILYTDCCGNETISYYGLGKSSIELCVQIGSLEPYIKNGNPAQISGIEYGGLSCNCNQ